MVSDKKVLICLKGWTIACLFFLVACQQESESYSVTFTGPVMGTQYRITIIVPRPMDLNQLESNIVRELNSVNESMSTYLESSEVNKINRLPANTPVKLSSSLNEVLNEALEISQLSTGAFDVTVADAVNLWGFGPDGSITSQPTTEQLSLLQTSVGYKNLSLENNVLIKRNSSTKIDLSAIAKGFAVDQVARLLLSEKIDSFLIDVGGELRLGGLNAAKQAWRVAIEEPQILGGIQQLVELSNVAIATSGDYRNFIEIDGNRYSHTIDPDSLKPVLHRLALVSVISDRASTADALATAMMSMGEDRAVEFANRLEIAAYFVIRGNDEDSYQVVHTSKFARFLR